MQVIDIDTIPEERIPHVRQGVFRSRKLLTGNPASPGNFALQLVSLPDTYDSPRHRHNFDQVRYQIEGEFDFASDGKMHPGSIAYFPEATRYGPQTSREKSLTLVLQFGGASGSGYISAEQYARAMEELSREGTFEKGVFTRTREDGSRVNQDAYEAVWERVNGRRLEYPKPRYARPVFMEPESFDWIPAGETPGAERKLLGVFSERGTRIVLYRVAAQASLPLEDCAVYFVDNGRGAVDEHPCDRYDTIYLEPGEGAVFTAAADTVLLQLGLPRFD